MKEILLWRNAANPPVFRTNRLFERVWKHNGARLGLSIALFLLFLISVLPLFLPDNSNAQNDRNKFAAPSFAHPLGTDQYGRDVLARIAVGGQRSLGAAVLVLAITLAVSLSIGITAALIGGWVETILMRLIDVLLAIPSLVLALAVVGVLGVGFENLMIAFVISFSAYYIRLARSYAVLARRRQDVMAARLAGVGWTRITAGHILPGVLLQMLIVATLDLGSVIVGISGLSFLGLGVQPPDAEWGAMLNESKLSFTIAPWLLLAPAAAIFLSVIAANSLGNALRDADDV